MSQMVPVTEKINTIAKHMQAEGFLRQLRMALPRSGVTAERMARIFITEVRRQPKLAECSIESLMGAAMQCAQLGLEPGPMGLAYIIPYGREAQLQLGYKGILNLIWRSEQISSIQAEVVYERDEFAWANGIPPKLHHVPAHGERGKATHAYAVIGTTAGGWIFRVMTASEVDKHRDRFSKAGKGSPWDTDWPEMACKTLLKRTAKRAPISTEAQAAIGLDDRAELGVAQEIDVTPPKTEPAEESDPTHPALPTGDAA
ncbi:MAG TPA: recombinase RecT [Candidatus Krumholzibacteria bacterium]